MNNALKQFTNNNIISITFKNDRKIIYVKSKEDNKPRTITVPIDAPEKDPYNKENGKGFMIPNAIMKSGLSSKAKLMFSALRSFISYDLGVVFPKREGQLEQIMSKSCSSNDKAIKELEEYGVIRVKKIPFQGHLKIYYYFEPEDKWRLPEPKIYKSGKDLIMEKSVQDTQSDNIANEVNNDTVVVLNDTIKEEFSINAKDTKIVNAFDEMQEEIDFLTVNDETSNTWH